MKDETVTIKSLPDSAACMRRIRQSARNFLVAALGAFTLLGTGTASASLITALDGLAPGDMYRIVFATGAARNATSHDIADYNLHVSNSAIAGSVTAPLGLSWSALASTDTVNAQSNTGVFASDATLVSFFNTDGILLATSGTDLWSGTLLAPISLNENGGSAGRFIYTGTDQFGVTRRPLGGTVGASGGTGSSPSSNSSWMNSLWYGVSGQAGLYGVSEKVTIATVPEPATLAIFGLGLMGLVSRRFKKHA